MRANSMLVTCTWSPRVCVEAHRRFHQIGDLRHLGGRARLVGGLASVAGQVPSTTTATDRRFTSPPSSLEVVTFLEIS